MILTKAYEDTRVSINLSKEQIEKLLKKFDVVATRFTSYPAFAELAFVRKSGERFIPYRVVVKAKIKPSPRSVDREMERAERQVWRVVYWWLKSKLEAIDFGLVEFEQELLPYMLVTDKGKDRTVAEVIFERLGKAISPPDDPFGGLRPSLPSGEK